jgi:hypothetical protein
MSMPEERRMIQHGTSFPTTGLTDGALFINNQDHALYRYHSNSGTWSIVDSQPEEKPFSPKYPRPVHEYPEPAHEASIGAARNLARAAEEALSQRVPHNAMPSDQEERIRQFRRQRALYFTVLKDWLHKGIRCRLIRTPLSISGFCAAPKGHPYFGEPLEELNKKIAPLGVNCREQGFGEDKIFPDETLWWYGLDAPDLATSFFSTTEAAGKVEKLAEKFAFAAPVYSPSRPSEDNDGIVEGFLETFKNEKGEEE